MGWTLNVWQYHMFISMGICYFVLHVRRGKIKWKIYTIRYVYCIWKYMWYNPSPMEALGDYILHRFVCTLRLYFTRAFLCIQICSHACVPSLLFSYIQTRPLHIRLPALRMHVECKLGHLAMGRQLRLKPRNAHSMSWRRGHHRSGCLRTVVLETRDNVIYVLQSVCWMFLLSFLLKQEYHVLQCILRWQKRTSVFVEAFVSAVGMGDDINAIIRTCPAPRDGESELACQVNGGILGAWVGNLAAKLALAASNCAVTLNVDAVCSAGVTGLVSAMGEIAAGAALGAASCAPNPPSLTTTKMGLEKSRYFELCSQPRNGDVLYCNKFIQWGGNILVS